MFATDKCLGFIVNFVCFFLSSKSSILSSISDFQRTVPTVPVEQNKTQKSGQGNVKDTQYLIVQVKFQDRKNHYNKCKCFFSHILMRYLTGAWQYIYFQLINCISAHMKAI